MEENKTNQPWQPYGGTILPVPEQQTVFPTGKNELIFAVITLVGALALCNFTMFGGFNLGFAMAAAVSILCATGYLISAGCKPSAYSVALLVLSVVIALGFARSDDGFVKFVMVCFLLVSVNLGLCLTAKQNLRTPGTVSSLLDAPRTVFSLGVGKMPEAFRGLKQAFRRSGSVGQKGGAFLLGLCLCIPVLAVVIPLLISADAAFDGLIALLPAFDFAEFFYTVLFGLLLWCVLYVRGAALAHNPKQDPKDKKRKGISAITVNTVLGAVGVVYLAYLISQLAYFFGGFAGILPEGYSTAEYARRGFFEMAVLSGINLGLIAVALGVVSKEKTPPVSTKILCLLVGLVTLFLVATASAKMFLYIDTYGLTRLRVLTQIIMLFLAITTLLVMIWLFVPKLPYMKAVILVALVIGAATFWLDVDTQVARYNVDAYLSGQLDSVDVSYIFVLGPEGAPQLSRLVEETTDSAVRVQAWEYLKYYIIDDSGDFRGWNYANHIAKQYLPDSGNE